MVFAFWEGRMPDYIKLCLRTWKMDYTLLDYDSVKKYIHFPKDKMDKFSLPQVADFIRVHILRDYGGYWLDTDTIMLNDKLPEENLIGDPIGRTSTAGFLHTEAHSPMFEAWAEYQDAVIANPNPPTHWSILVNDFSDSYTKFHKEISIADVTNCWAETYMIWGNAPRWEKYRKFYFDESHKLSDINSTNMLMLHNSWTPNWYKILPEKELLAKDCTLSNIFNEIL